MPKNSPIAVLISDSHFTLASLDVATTAFRMAIEKAAELEVPLVDCGDITDTKAILRAEIVNRLIETMHYAKSKGVTVYCIVGNHSLLNEKSEEHALHFLDQLENVHVISKTSTIGQFSCIPYQNSPTGFLYEIRSLPHGSIVLAHQGTVGGQLGHYVQDTVSFDPRSVQEYRTFLGHYHAGYELYNTVSIGTPYTTSFGEAKDIPKGFLVVYEDGRYTRHPTNLRKHVVIEIDISKEGAMSLLVACSDVKKDDLLWIKLTGTKQDLDNPYYDKKSLQGMVAPTGFKLDKIPTDAIIQANFKPGVNPGEILDTLLGDRDDLKTLWRTIASTDM